MVKMLGSAVAITLGLAAADSTTKEIAPGIMMPRVNLGTCCGSDPKVGYGPWLDAGGVGVDTATSYNDQKDIAAQIKAKGTSRDQLFITSKVEQITTAASCLAQVKEILDQLQVDNVDLTLIHHPHADSNNQACWKGLEQAQQQGLTKSIGLSNFNQKQIEAVMEIATIKPAVNQCSMSVKTHDDATINYCQSQNITYEAFFVMRGCPHSDATLNKIATAHGKSPFQVCVRYILDRGCVAAVGTGSDPVKTVAEAKSNIDVFDFQLSKEELNELNSLGGSLVV